MKLIEAKQVGVLYHITSIINLLSILKTNQLQGAVNGTSTTRDRLGWKTMRGIAGNQCMIVLDGDKLSNKYRIQPYQDTTDSYTDEQEETIITRVINNIDRYILKIVFLKPDNWIFRDRQEMMVNRLIGNDLEDELSIESIISFIDGEYSIPIEVL